MKSLFVIIAKLFKSERQPCWVKDKDGIFKGTFIYDGGRFIIETDFFAFEGNHDGTTSRKDTTWWPSDKSGLQLPHRMRNEEAPKPE